MRRTARGMLAPAALVSGFLALLPALAERAQAAILPNPLFELRFDDGLALSNSGTGSATATLVGDSAKVTFVDGMVGRAVDLGNTTGGSSGNQHVAVGQALPDVGTISTWYRATTWYNYQSVLDNSVEPNDWEMWVYNNGVLRMRMNEGYGDVSYDLDNLRGPNNWYHVVYTWDRNDTSGSAASLYVNGQLRASDDIPAWTAPATLAIGGGNAGNTSGNGLWDQFKIYDVRLDAAQVAYQYASVPVVQWNMDGSLANSGSGGSACDGTLVDGANGSHAYVAGRIGQGLDLGNPNPTTDKTQGDYVSTNYTMPDEGTVALWYYAEDWYNYQTIFDNSVHQDQWEFWIYNNGIARFRVGGGSEVSFDLDNLDGPESWYHLAVSWQRDGSTVDTQLYVNGVLRDENTGSWATPGTSFFLGGGNDGNTYGTGIWDDVRIYERSLSLNEVRTLAQVPEPAALLLLALGAPGLCFLRRRRDRG